MARYFKSVMRRPLRTNQIPDSSTAQRVLTQVRLSTWWQKRLFPPARLLTIFSVERPRGRMSIEPWRPALLAITTKHILCKFKFDRRMSQCPYFTNVWSAASNGTRNKRIECICLGQHKQPTGLRKIMRIWLSSSRGHEQNTICIKSAQRCERFSIHCDGKHSWGWLPHY